MNSQTSNNSSVWTIMVDTVYMKNGGILITNDNERINVTSASLENNKILYTKEDGENGCISLFAIKEARPLHLDCDLPTRISEAPIDDRDNDKEFKGDLCIEFQGGDNMNSRLSSRKDYKSYDVVLPLPSKLKRSEGCYDCLTKKRKLEEEIPPTVQNTPVLGPSENALLDFPSLERPSFIEPLPSPRKINKSISEIEEVEMIPKSEYNKLEDDFAKLLKLMFNNNYLILQDACESGYNVKIRFPTAEQNVYSVLYTFEYNDEKFAVLKDHKKTLHINVQDIITVIPGINTTPETYLNTLLSTLDISPFYEGESINISNKDYWNFKPLNINGDDVLVHQETGIIVSMNDDTVMFEAVLDEKKYTYEQLFKIREWVKKCGIFDYPITPRKKEVNKEVPMAPRKNKHPMVNRELKVARKLNFDSPSTYSEKTNLKKDVIVHFCYKGKEQKRVLVKVSNDKYLEGICQEDKKYKKYLVKHIEKLISDDEEDSSNQETPVIKNRSKEIRAPRKEGNHLNIENTPNCDRKLDFDNSVNPKRKSIREPRKEQSLNLSKPTEEDIAIADMIAFLKFDALNKNVKFNYKKQAKIVTVIEVTDKYLIGICNRDKRIKKYILEYIYDIVLDDKEKQKNNLKDILREASKNNKTIFIKYSKGSIPDVKRPIKIIGFQNSENGNDLVVAECLIEGSIRKFKLEHIEIVA